MQLPVVARLPGALQVRLLTCCQVALVRSHLLTISAPCRLGAYLGIAFMVFFIMLLIGIFWCALPFSCSWPRCSLVFGWTFH